MGRILGELGRRNLLLMGVQGFYWCANCTYFGFLVLYLQDNGYSNTQCAMAQVFIALATLATQPVIGYITDTYISCKKLLLLATALAVPVAFLLQASVSFPAFCYIAIILQAALFNPAPSIIDSWTMALMEKDPNVRYPVTRGAGSLLYALTALVFGQVIARLGDSVIAVSFCVFAALMFLCVLFLDETPCRNRRGEGGRRRDDGRISGGRAVKMLLRNKNYVLFIVSCLLYNIANKSTGGFLSNYVAKIGSGSGGLGMLLFFSATVEFPSMLIVGWLMRRYPLSRLHLAALGGMIVKNLCFLLAGSMPVLALGKIAEGISYGAYTYLFVEYIGRNTPKQLNVTAISLGSAMTSSLGGILGNSAAGFILDKWGLVPLSVAAMAAAAVSVAVFLPCAVSRGEKHA